MATFTKKKCQQRCLNKFVISIWLQNIIKDLHILVKHSKGITENCTSLFLFLLNFRDITYTTIQPWGPPLLTVRKEISGRVRLKASKSDKLE